MELIRCVVALFCVRTLRTSGQAEDKQEARRSVTAQKIKKCFNQIVFQLPRKIKDRRPEKLVGFPFPPTEKNIKIQKSR
jgi:hypothetical protein